MYEIEAGGSIALQPGLGERFANAGLVGAERAAALQQERDTLEWRTADLAMGFCASLRADRCGSARRVIGLSHLQKSAGWYETGRGHAVRGVGSRCVRAGPRPMELGRFRLMAPNGRRTRLSS